MRTEELLEQCLQALTSGEELPPDLARYLARHPEQRAEVENLLSIAQNVSRMPVAELTTTARKNMHTRLAARFGFDPAVMDPLPKSEHPGSGDHAQEQPALS